MMTFGLRKTLQIVLGATAGLFAWPLMEGLIAFLSLFPDYLSYTAVSGAVFGLAYGAFLGSAEGIAAARTRRILTGALWGALAGVIGGAAGFLFGQGLLFVAGEYLSTNARITETFALPLARAAGWAVLGLFVGTASGFHSGSARKCGIGALGGVIGGLVGGALIEFGLVFFPGSPVVRALGLSVFGALLGLSFALVERRLSFGVMRVLNGRLKGREYLLNQRRTTIGEYPRCDIPVSTYRAVAPVHATILRRGRDLLIESVAGPLTVNEEKTAEARPLKYDDVVACGSIHFILRRE
jgi:hypothetical protein